MNWLGFFTGLAWGLGILDFIVLFIAIAFSTEGEEHRPWIVFGVIAVLFILSIAMIGGLS